jgi:putative transcription antitermination factor YqgF
MKKVLGLDYGDKRIGAALLISGVIEPVKTIEYRSFNDFVFQLKEIINDLRVNKLVWGLSSGKMAKKTKIFAHKVEKVVKLPIEFQDESLTTYDTKRYLDKGQKFKKDAISAALILQNYYDERGKENV